MSIIHKHITLILFHLVFLAVVATNFPFGKYFLGWDSLSPELNFPLNFQRAFSAFWQENYGLGLLGGHGFAATLPHTLITFLLSLVLPQEAIRPAFTLLILYLGALGMYLLLQLLLKSSQEKSRPTKQLNWISLFGALFYMLNLGTVQMFYTQLETFIAHFAALPWLFFIVIKVLKSSSLKHLLLFLVINFFATLQGFIPSLFAVYFVALIIFLFTYVVLEKSSFLLKRSLLIIALTLAINAYWLFPLLYFQTTRVHTFLDSYNNLISTPHFIDVNKKYGDLVNIPLLKGFLFDSYQLDGFILQPWINHLSNIPVLITGYGFFALVLLGILFTILKTPSNQLKALILVFLFFFSNLALDVFPFSYAIKIIHLISPTYEQAFRNTFTKFSLGLAFSYAIFATFGLLAIFKLFKNHLDIKKQLLIVVSLFIILIYYALPVFQGQLIYQKLMINPPSAYFDIFAYFKDKEDARIVDLPQGCPEGWLAYNWGYFGSGFYWYAIQQPFLARTFDVWSNHNERYYWEISQAIREQDYTKVDFLLQKYQAKWVLYDPNTLHCRNEKWAFHNQSLLEYLETSPNYSLLKVFDAGVINPIRLYENKNYSLKSFISIYEELPNIGPKDQWLENDSAYYQLGDYITTSQKKFDFYYPFRSLFTKREIDKKTSIENETDWLIFQTQLPPGLEDYLMKIKGYQNFEKGIPLELLVKHIEQDLYALNGSFLLPQIYLDNIRIAGLDSSFELGRFRTKYPERLSLELNGEILNPKPGTTNAYQGVFYFTLSNTVLLLDDNQTPLLVFSPSSDPNYLSIMQNEFSVSLPTYEQGLLKVFIPKIGYSSLHSLERFSQLEESVEFKACSPVLDSSQNRYEIATQDTPQFVRLLSKASSYCLTLDLPDLPTSFGYLLELKTRNIKGNPFFFSLIKDNKTVYEKVALVKNKNFSSSYHIIPPSFQSDFGYQLSIENVSESYDPTVNDLAGVGAWYIPYAFINELVFESPALTSSVKEPLSPRIQGVKHKSEAIYEIDIENLGPNKSALVLSQSFDEGWKAYRVQSFLNTTLPFLFGKELKEHVLVNGWANGWLLDNYTLDAKRSTLVIIYLPQYLQYLGFGLLLGVLLLLVMKLRK